MPATSHLVNRSGVFYWRRRVPRALAAAFGRSHLVLSLRVREPAPARRLARRVSVRFDDFVRVMELERRTPSPDEQREILKALYQVILEGRPEDQIAALVGHARKGITGRVYFKRFPTSVINETLRALEYGIDLSHVRRR